MGDPKDPLRDLRRLSTGAMGPCVRCRKQLLETALPLFTRFDVLQCGIDGAEVMRHVGLARSMAPGVDGLALASVLGPSCNPVIVMDETKGVNLCQTCMTDVSFSVLEFLSFVHEEGKADG